MMMIMTSEMLLDPRNANSDDLLNKMMRKMYQLRHSNLDPIK